MEHPERIRLRRTCHPSAGRAWCVVGALDYARPDDALYGIAGGPPDARRAVLVVSPPGVDAVRARRVLSGSCARWRAPGSARCWSIRVAAPSALAFEETSLQTHVADIRDGLHELARRFPKAHRAADRRALRRRSGANRRAARPAADALLLVDPSDLDVRAALRQDLRGEIAKRMRGASRPRTERAVTRS